MGIKPTTRVEAALDELCRRFGYCLKAEDSAAIMPDPPKSADAFVDAVLIGEGLDPKLCDKHSRTELIES